jgi:hypothetical protein
MVPVKLPHGVTVQYKVKPLLRYMVTRTTENEDASVEEEIAMLVTIDDAREMVRAMTDWDRRNPQDAGVKVLDFGDAEIH